MKFSLIMVCLLYSCLSTAQSSGDLQEFHDITYYQGFDYDSVNHKLNLLIPQQVDSPPLLIWIGGGAWSYVDRNQEMHLARNFANKGVAVAAVGHRLSNATWVDSTLSPGLKHPEHAHDVARAIKFLHDQADQYGYSSINFFIGGFSSGAHLAAIVTMNNRFLSDQGLPEDLMRGVIPIGGTFDVQHYHKILVEAMGQTAADRHIETVFGLTEAEMTAASPTNFMDGLKIPMLLISDRNMVRYHMFFEERLRQHGYQKFQALNLHQFSHAELWRHFSNAENSEFLDLILKFIKKHSLDQT